MRPGTLTLAALPPLSLYVHLPWCLKKCPYCDFNSHAVRGALEELPQRRYLDALRADLEASLPFVWGRRVHTIFIGGGTPSLFAPEAIERLLPTIRARAAARARLRDHARGQSGHLRARALPRLSRRRREPAVDRRAELRRRAASPRSAACTTPRRRAPPSPRRADAFETFNIDLMYALPGQTLAECEADLDAALAFAPPHLSVYHLTIEPNTCFAKHPPPLPDDDLAVDDARPHHRAHRRGRPRALRGLGLRAPRPSLPPQPQLLGVRRLPRHRRRRARQAELPAPRRAPGALRDPAAYMAGAEAGTAIASESEVARAELPFEFMLNALRLREGFELARFTERTGLPLVGDRARPLERGRAARPDRARPASRPPDRARLRFPQRPARAVPAGAIALTDSGPAAYFSRPDRGSRC